MEKQLGTDRGKMAGYRPGTDHGRMAGYRPGTDMGEWLASD